MPTIAPANPHKIPVYSYRPSGWMRTAVENSNYWSNLEAIRNKRLGDIRRIEARREALFEALTRPFRSIWSKGTRLINNIPKLHRNKS